MKLSFGSELICPFSEGVLTRKTAIKATEPSDWLVFLAGARIAVASEPSAAAINGSAVVKQITGREEISWRPLRGRQQRNVFQVSLRLQTNFEMNMAEKDQALIKRAKTIHFSTTQTKKLQPEFEKEQEYLKHIFASYLVHQVVRKFTEHLHSDAV